MKLLRLLVVVLFQRPLILILLSLFYVVDAILAFHHTKSDKLVVGLLVMSLLPTMGIFAISTERIRALAVCSAELGVPHYRSSLLRAQCGIVVIFLLIPMVGLLADGADPLLASLLVAPAAFGILLVLLGRWVIFGAAGFFLLNKTGANLGDLFLQSWVRIAVVGIGAWVLAYWLVNLLKTRSAAAAAPMFADSRQDINAHTVADATGAKLAHMERYYSDLDQQITALGRSIGDAGVSLRALCFGLGLKMDIRPRPLFMTVGVSVIALGSWDAMHGQRLQIGGYVAFTALLVLTALSRIETLSRTLRRTVVEQSLLVLTPTWPERRRLKNFLLTLAVRYLVPSWLTWCAVTLVAVVARWISMQWVYFGAICYGAAASAAVACLLIELTRRSVRLETLLNSSILLLSVIGAVLWIVGIMNDSPYQLVGALVIALPLLAATSAYWLRPLQFPMTVSGAAS